MVKEKAPSAIVPGISRFGMSLARNISAAKGIDGEDDDEERHAAIGEDGADEHDREHGAAGADHADHRLHDRFRSPRASITLPNTARAGRREVGFTKPAIFSMKTPVNIGGTADGSVSSTASWGGDRREEDHAEAAIGNEHQERSAPSTIRKSTRPPSGRSRRDRPLVCAEANGLLPIGQRVCAAGRQRAPAAASPPRGGAGCGPGTEGRIRGSGVYTLPRGCCGARARARSSLRLKGARTTSRSARRRRRPAAGRGSRRSTTSECLLLNRRGCRRHGSYGVHLPQRTW